tara:strand:+ start:581 stop:1138 length:558 start_codon:yes stop_codon:yes gene_type:complete
MSLWGNDIKPKNLTDAEKKEVYATKQGWVREAGSILSGNGNTSADPEVLVAISNLSANMGAANITEIEFVTTSFDKSDGGNIDVRVRFNEPVTVTGTPQLTITNDTPSRNLTADYLSGSTTNELIFRETIAASNAATNAGDVLSIGANATALNGGTIKDTGEGTVATITNVASIGTAAGTITVAA